MLDLDCGEARSVADGMIALALQAEREARAEIEKTLEIVRESMKEGT